MSKIEDRKKDHVALTLDEITQYHKSTGFEKYDFRHNALPELDFNEISTETILMGRTFSFPLFISSMTGGYDKAKFVNAVIAEFCESQNLPFGVGSQRAMLEDENLTKTFSIVREKAPNAFICSNIGGAQLINGLGDTKIRAMIDSIQADAVIIHLNPLQELMQPEGDRDFKGVLEGIEKLTAEVNLPVIVKETGAGISKYTAKRLLNVGVTVIDVAGAGGTSWAKVENERANENSFNLLFNDWGIPTTDCLEDLSGLQWERGFEIIASGGVRSSFDIAKSLCLGANFTATAQPVIKEVMKNGEKGLIKLLDQWKYQFKVIMALLGCTSVTELNKSHLIRVS